MDDVGYKMIKSAKEKGFFAKLGILLVKSLPVMIRILSVVGTIALIMVSGGILVHNIEYLHHLLPGIPSLVKEVLMGLLAGLFALAVVTGGKKEPAVKNKQLTSREPHGKHLRTDQAIRTNQIKADTIVYSESLYINQQLFVVHQTNNDRIFVIKENRDTIFTRNDFSPDFEFKDFNGDGYKDIIIHYRTNVPGIEDLLLYAADEKTFKEVLDFQSFPAPEKIKGTDYYYSYHRSGCADMNWTSDLFYIKNYKAIRIGTIEGYECGNAGIKDAINGVLYKNTGKKTGDHFCKAEGNLPLYRNFGLPASYSDAFS
eukprot:gene20907-24848_t